MEKLLKGIKKLKKRKDKLIIGIDGPAASGKSTLSKIIADKFSGTIIEMDDYFLTDDLRTIDRLNSVGENIDHERMYREIFTHLNDDKIDYHKYNCGTKLFEDKTQEMTEVVIIEGVYAARPEFKRFYDILIYVDVDKATQLARLETRNPKLLDRFINEWLPMEEKYFNAFDVKSRADYIVKM